MAADTDLIILDGCTFFYSDQNGDVDAKEAEGLFYQDVRHLSRCEALVDATRAFTNQLPEVFAGFGRDETNVPIEYPDALKPQAWAAAAPLLALRTLLGLDVVDGRLRARPVKSNFRKLRLRNVTVRGSHSDAP